MSLLLSCAHRLRMSIVVGAFAVAIVLSMIPHRLSAQDGQPVGANDKVTVELVDAGTPPRTELRFKPKPGAEQSVVMTMDMQVKMTIAGQQPPQPLLPAQRMTIKAVVDDVAPNGDISFSYEYTEVEVVTDPNNPSPLVAPMQQLLAGLVGIKGTGVVSSRGITKSGRIDVPPDTPAQLKQLLEGMKDALNVLSSPVPEQAVGVGASWNVLQNVEINGMKLKQQSIHELTELTKGGFAMTVTLSQSADPQQIKNPALPATVKLTLKSLKTSGKGTSKIDIALILPLVAEVSAESKADMLMEVGGQKQTMITNTSIKTTVEPPEK